MKLITEAELKVQFEKAKPRIYYIPEGKVLSPSARDYLNCQRVQLDVEKNRKKDEPAWERPMSPNEPECKKPMSPNEFGCKKSECRKPEFMTHIYGNELVAKDDPLICYRGKLDSIQAEIVLTQSVAAERSGNERLIANLGEILNVCRELMRCELMNDKMQLEYIIGLTMEELREHSHHAERYYGVRTMELPEYGKGTVYALLNLLRTSAREAEVMAVRAFRKEGQITRMDIIEVLNRLSSALHVMMCRYVSGKYYR